MAAITVAKYQTVANLYANAQRQIAGVTDYYYDAAYEIVLLQSFDPEIDLLQPFYNAYLSSQTVFLQVPAGIVNAITQLQRHVLDKARTESGNERFTSINDWIDAGASNGAATTALGRNGDTDVSFRVPTEFATISLQAGYEIDSENIETV